jgi:trypsin
VMTHKLTLSVILTSILVTSVWEASLRAQEEIRPAGRRVVGGEKTDIKLHPWQVALNIAFNGNTYLCGGSLIADRWVLTAAHCMMPGTQPQNVRAKSGATNYTTTGAWAEVEWIVIHKDYNPATHEHDLALLRVRPRPDGRIIPLATSAQAPALGTPLEVTGWGATSEDGESSRVLLKGIVPYADNATCNGPTAYKGAIRPGMMCAGYREGGVDSCQGDSGGPLVWRTADGPVLVGVVSWGEGCARKLRYGVYTRVASYRHWIEAVIAQNNR